MHRLTRHRAALLAAAAVSTAVLALTGCASEKSEMPTDTAVSEEQWQHDFESCLKDEGVELDESGGIPVNPDGTFGDGEDGGDTEAALQKCSEKLGPAPQSGGAANDEQLEEQMQAYAKCMREAGYDVPDPKLDDNGAGVVHGGPDADPADVERCTAEAGLGDEFGAEER